MKKNTLSTAKKCSLQFAIFLLATVNILAQKNTDILIGEKVPDISFTHLVNHTTKTAKLSDFAGKLVIIDFWNTGCSPCIAAFPKLDSLQKKFRDKIQIIAVAPENESVIADFVDRMKTIRHIDLSFPFEAANKQLESVFKHIYVPHEVWIGPDGIAKATTEEVTAEKINKALNGKASDLVMKTDRQLLQVDWNRPMETKRLGEVLYFNDQTAQDTNLHYISVLTKRIDNIESSTTVPALEPRARIGNSSIINLYQLAFGLQTKERIFPHNWVHVQVTNSESLLVPSDTKSYKDWFEKNSYCYEINFPDYHQLYPKGITTEMKDLLAKEMGNVMQKDLERYFGYRAGFEKVKQTCLILSVKDSTKLFTKGGKPKQTNSPGYLGINFINMPLNRIAKTLNYYHPTRILINETGYSRNVDLEINTRLTDWVSLAKALEPYGLLLNEQERWVEMLVIRDGNNSKKEVVSN
jgi:thiol-disulfide isomerase/thioredoxin